MQLRNSQWSAEFYKAIILFPGVQLRPTVGYPKKKKKKEKRRAGRLPNQTAPSSHFQLHTSEAD